MNADTLWRSSVDAAREAITIERKTEGEMSANQYDVKGASGEDIWRFATAFYRLPSVADACLVLQARLSADVNIILLGLFASLEWNVSLDSSQFSEARSLVHDWHQSVVKKLRGLRTELKSGPLPAPSPVTNALRERVKAAELEAERIELVVLAEWLAALDSGIAEKNQRDAIAVMMDFHEPEGQAFEGDLELSGAWAVLARAAANWKGRN